MNRTDPAAAGDRWIRRGTGAAVLVVAGIAAVISFQHIQHLALTHGQTQLAAVLLPLSIDGTVAAASLVMLRAARMGIGTPWLARGMLALSVLATLAANIGYGLPYGAAGALLSGWPAAAFIGCAEMAILMVRRARPAVPVRVPARSRESVREIRARHRVSSGTAVKMQKYADAAVKAASNGHASQ
jgi:hypothetical protein